MRTVAIIQARMGSTRLPGKVLMDLGGETTLGRVVRRLSRAKSLTQIAVATTDSPADDAILSESERLGVACFRGSEQDVLSRYAGAAEQFAADTVVRITSDCPLIDAGIVDQVLEELRRSSVDFAYNDVEHGFPRGLDVEAFSRDVLKQAMAGAHARYQREHVTPFFYEHPELFKATVVRSGKDFSAYRWTLDTPEDLKLIRAVYEHFSNTDEFDWHSVVELMEQSPELATINEHVIQKSGHEAAPF